jgi:hypothetical protein
MNSAGPAGPEVWLALAGWLCAFLLGKELATGWRLRQARHPVLRKQPPEQIARRRGPDDEGR